MQVETLRWPSVPRRIVRRIVALALIPALALGVLMWCEEWFIFFPNRFPWGNWQPTEITVKDVYFLADDGTRLHGWYCPVDQPRAVILLSHGNAGNVTDRIELVQLLQAKLEMSVFVYDYRGYGRSEGRPCEAGLYQDGMAAYQYLVEKLGVEPNNVVLWGESLGTAVTLELARRVPHRAVVLHAPFTSIPDMVAHTIPWLPARHLVRNQFDNLDKIRDVSTPVIIVHGTKDSIVPLDMGHALYVAARQPKRFLAVPGADHNDLWWKGGQYVLPDIFRFLTTDHESP